MFARYKRGWRIDKNAQKRNNKPSYELSSCEGATLGGDKEYYGADFYLHKRKDGSDQ
ncbi:hypothetical protein [Bartonella harrusi]|uniref:hypothetical protein n=1 Tax=Bartonella harrusi TaxID=2961895 RepID=UPI0035A8BA02